MDANLLIFHLLVILVASRAAAEVAERLHVPAVVLEILTGLAIGPSVLNLVGENNVLGLFGEIGAILLLLEVGMQMRLADLSRVGASALRVAAIGVLTPMILGFIVLKALGIGQMPALFLAAGITATSVGITARVFGDLKMLASPEARTVLGAAVADDVAGLLILTVVVGIAQSGRIALVPVATVVATGIGFVIVAATLSVWLSPWIFSRLNERARTEGSLMALGLSFALLVARLAAVVRLAPIVGAFLAGLGISESGNHEELRRRLAPVGHLFIPIFFLNIGLDTRIETFARARVLSFAAALAAIAVVGKLLAGLGVGRAGGDKLLVGISMVPRGEVGLIFASLGLSRGILGADSYALLVAVVLFTTLLPPPWMRHRVHRSRKRAVSMRSVSVEPPGGWITSEGEQVELAADPPRILGPRLGLEAAVLCASARPGPRLVEWLSQMEPEEMSWDEPLRERLFRLLSHGNERSWRFMEVTGLAGNLLPAVADAVHKRRRDPFDLDPAGALRWNLLEDLNDLVKEGRDPAVPVWDGLSCKHLVRLAALAREAFAGEPNPPEMAGDLAASIGLSGPDKDLVNFLVAERHLLVAAARRLAAGAEDSILELAAHAETAERAGALYMLAVAEDAIQPWERERLDELFELILRAFDQPELSGPGTSSLIAQKREQVLAALSHLPRSEVVQHIEAAPRRYLLKHGPQVIARHLKMIETRPAKTEVRLEVEPGASPGLYTVHVAALDREGLLADIAQALTASGVSILEAFVSTWRSGLAIDVFRVRAPRDVDWEDVRLLMAALLVGSSDNGQPAPAIEGILKIDNLSSPWHTVLEVQAGDREGLLHRVARAIALAGMEVQMATVSTVGELAVDTFFVTRTGGGKLDAQGEERLRLAFAGKPIRRWRIPRHRSAQVT